MAHLVGSFGDAVFPWWVTASCYSPNLSHQGNAVSKSFAPSRMASKMFTLVCFVAGWGPTVYLQIVILKITADSNRP